MEPEVVERLQRILRNARDIKQVIHRVGQKMAPAEAVPTAPHLDKHPKLRDCRILVVDADDRVRNDAHALLERYGCDVETARSGGEAIFMFYGIVALVGFIWLLPILPETKNLSIEEIQLKLEKRGA